MRWKKQVTASDLMRFNALLMSFVGVVLWLVVLLDGHRMVTIFFVVLPSRYPFVSAIAAFDIYWGALSCLLRMKLLR